MPFALLVVLLSCGCAASRSVKVLRLGHGLDTQHPVHQAMAFLARRAEELSQGQLRIDLYPSEQLGSERELLELLQIGSVDLTKVSASVLEGFSPAFRVFGLPYIFHDQDHLWRVLDGPIGRELLLQTRGQRLLGLAYYDAGSRSFYTRERAVETPADLDGLKIRTQESATAMAMVSSLGGAPTPIAWGELYTALQQGVVDGAENNPPSFHLSGHYEVCRYYTLDEHTAVPDVLLIATSTWEQLSEAERRYLERATRDSVELQRQLWREATERALATVADEGVEILRPEKALFRSQVGELLAQLGKDPSLRPWLERIAAEAPPANEAPRREPR